MRCFGRRRQLGGTTAVEVPPSTVLAPAKVFATLAVTVDSDPDTGGLADAVRASASGRSTENGAAGPGAGPK
ncbi:hypothetical protein BZL29_5547 [Mycobacterium kansasii]|uniref:Uncharacterized protein n=1 Tax=Mycobacterium kansasii TaxID=1768 RepID=A0A1V3WWF6_MYCKA|nr:hypothetical protein BZL29_5547 [Mycobacterium kansasii]